jgi:vitamin B12 transporter
LIHESGDLTATHFPPFEVKGAVMRHVIGILMVALAVDLAAAQTEETKRVEPVVVTATKVETPVAELGASVTVVNGDDFQTYHYSSADEALRNVPGLEIRRSGSLGKVSSAFIRGANSNQVQVLVDGVRVKSPTTGQADLSDISPDLIERIEIIRGPQSTLYGADAIGGVINIITRKGKGAASGSIELEGGNYDTWATRAAAGGSFKILDYSLSASHLESNGQFKNDNFDINALNGRIGVSLPAESSLSFVVRYNKNETGLPIKAIFPPPQPITPIIDPNQKQQSETLVMTLEGQTHPVPWWESRVRLSRYTNEFGFQDAPDPGFVFESPFRSQIDVERREAEWVNSFHIGKWSTSTIGLEYRREQGDDKGVFHKATETWSGLFEEQLRFFDRLFLTAGFRVEDHSVFGTATTGRGSIAYDVKEWGTRLHGSAGSGFRAPTINDLFFPGFSNPALQPERSLSWDAGVGQKLWQDHIRLDATYFHTDFRDLIQFVPLDVFPFATVDNVGRARAEGLEFTVEADLWYNLIASASYTFTDTKNLTTGDPLPRVPKHSGNVGLTWEPIRRLSLFTQLYVRSSQFDNFGNIFNSGYTRVDIGGTYRLLDRYGWLQALEATARVQNLFNEHYAEVHGFPALGINFLLGVRARF